jgi:hypothetical protein
MSFKYPQKARDASFNNVNSGLAAVNVQDALEELAAASLPFVDWTSWTPTGSWTGAVSYSGKFCIIAGIMECRVELTHSGTPTGSTLEIDLPDGWEANPAAFTRLTTQNNALGFGIHVDFGSTQDHDVMVHAIGNDPDRVRVRYKSIYSGALVLNNLTPSAPFSVVNTDFTILTWRIPVIEE